MLGRSPISVLSPLSICLCVQRFFILRRDFPSLSYFTSEDNLELLGEIPILPDTIVLDRSAAGHAPYRFQIRSDAKTLLLEAESRDNQRRWIDACQDLVDSVRADKFRSSTTALTHTSLMDRESSDSRPSGAHASSLARQSSMTKATSATASALGRSVPSAFSVDVEFVPPSATSPTAAHAGASIENNPLFANSSRGLLDDPSIDWEKLLEASSSSSWNDESDAESDGGDAYATGPSALALEPMAEDQVVDNNNNNALHSRRGRSQSGKITIVSLNPNAVVQLSRRRRPLYDISIEVTLGRRSKLLRSDASSDKTGCFMRISGYLKQTKDLVDIGSTDAIRVATLLAASEKSQSVPFTVVVSAELEQFAQLRFTLYKCSLNQSPGTAQACLGVGRCHVTDNFLQSYVKTLNLSEKVSTRESLQDALTAAPAAAKQPQTPDSAAPVAVPEEVVAQTSRGGAPLVFAPANDGITIAIRAFPSVAPQEILPTTGIDMADTKYLIPTTLSPTDGALEALQTREPQTRHSSARVLTDNGSFLGTDASPPAVRFIALDEILRVPRSTFALPLAYLDYLEEEVLERTRRLRKHLASKHSANHAYVTLIEAELEYCRKKTEEYMKQRQFLMRQEKRLLDEQETGTIADALRTLKKAVATAKPKDKDTAAPEIVAPFKRSTYKSLDGWQFLPTNMQDQFLCAYQASGAAPFVWHTMTMGCPAAHTKGFANGGYPHTDMKPGEYNSTSSQQQQQHISSSGYSNPATSPVGVSMFDEPCTSPMGGPSAAASTQTEKTRRKSRVSHTKSPHQAATDESLASLKTRLDLKDRLDIIGSQILSAAVACIIATLDLAAVGSAPHRSQLAHALSFGYLMNFESLLSTQGKEIGMLEDFAAGAKWLRNVFVQFRKHKTTGDHFMIKNYAPSDRRAFAQSTGGPTNENNAFEANGDAPGAGSSSASRSGHYLLVTIGVMERHMRVLPPLLATGKPFRVRCVLFTQGVNEKQTLVHAYKANSVKVQDRINRDNLEELKDLYAIFRRLHANDDTPTGLQRRASTTSGDALTRRVNLSALDSLLAQIEHHICAPSNQFKKNVGLLMDSSDFCRELGGSRVTCCKSGKDRTAMSVTLEQARICMSELQATQSATLCASMRLYGVRRKNVFLNTKADKFAFNEVQRKMLPECYKPPPGTYKSGKT